MRKGEILEVVEVRPTTVADVLAAAPPAGDAPDRDATAPDRSRRTVRA